MLAEEILSPLSVRQDRRVAGLTPISVFTRPLLKVLVLAIPRCSQICIEVLLPL